MIRDSTTVISQALRSASASVSIIIIDVEARHIQGMVSALKDFAM